MSAVAGTVLPPSVDELGRRVKIDPSTGARNLTIQAETGWIIQCELLIPVIAGDLSLSDVPGLWHIGAEATAA